MSAGSTIDKELVVIGAGPGGYAAAFQAADMGLKVAMITDEPRLGGVCLLRGCIPSKALLHIAKLINETSEAHHWGVAFSRPKIDLDRVREWKDEVIAKLAGGIDELCKRREVDIIHARARFVDSRTLRLDRTGSSPRDLPEFLRFENAIVATGSQPVMPGIFNVGDPRVMDSTGGLALPDCPDSLLVIGGGYIGLEMGTVYNALGAEVTVIELMDGLLPGADRDLVRPLEARLRERFQAIHLNTRVSGLEPTPEGIRVLLEGEEVPPEMVVDRVMVAVGRRPNSANLGLETTRVVLDDKGFIQTDRRCQSDDPTIYAIGDVAGEPMLAHKASRQGKVAVQVIAGEAAEFDSPAIPAVVFTDPEVAWAGLTENQAKAQGRKITVSRFPWAASGRAATLGRSDGVTKMIVDPENDRLLGIGITGPGAGDLIAEGVLAIEMAAVARDVAESIHAHPTLSETSAEAAEAYFGHATHLFRPKK